MTTQADTDDGVVDAGESDGTLFSPTLRTFPWLEASAALTYGRDAQA